MAAGKSRKVLALPQPFAVKKSRIQGKGGFATRDIRKGERVVEYVGERISWKEADRRYDDDGMGRHHTFLFAVTTRTVIDGAVDGNDSRFINHACDPNCEAIDVNGRIFVEAMRAIAAGEELFYDYAYARDATTTAEDEEVYRCRCGSPKCRGSILEPVKKSRTLPTTHHAAARHPHEHVGAEPTAGSTKRAKGTKKSGKQAGKPAGKPTGKQAGKPAGKPAGKSVGRRSSSR